METEDISVLELAKKIVDSHGKNHINEFASIGIKTYDDLVNHIYETLIKSRTLMIRCANGLQSTNSGVCFAYDKETNTMIVFNPDRKDFDHTAYRPDDKERRFKVKCNNVTRDQGHAPEIKQGIYELLPELKNEAEKVNTTSANAEKVKRRYEAMMRKRRENNRDFDYTRDRSNERDS